MKFAVLDFLRRQDLLEHRAEVSVSLLEGGFWNDNFRVRGPGIDWVVKRYRKEHRESLFPNLPNAEAQALSVLHAAQVAPERVAFFETAEEHPILVYQYWPGQVWHQDVVPIAQLLRRLHALAVDRSDFRALPVDAAGILAQGDQLLDGLPPDDLVRRLRARRPEPVEGPSLIRPALVHTDVGAGNLIVGPEGVRLIDWQCPGIGDPAEDLWAFLAPVFQILFAHAPLTRAESELFVETYGEAETAARLAHLSPYFAYRMTAYCCRRTVELAGKEDAVSQRYRRAGAAQIETLSQPGKDT
jgi:thiamine kinase